jgi:hypothetical protein
MKVHALNSRHTHEYTLCSCFWRFRHFKRKLTLLFLGSFSMVNKTVTCDANLYPIASETVGITSTNLKRIRSTTAQRHESLWNRLRSSCSCNRQPTCLMQTEVQRPFMHIHYLIRMFFKFQCQTNHPTHHHHHHHLPSPPSFISFTTYPPIISGPRSTTADWRRATSAWILSYFRYL